MVAAGLLILSILPLALGRPSSHSSALVTRSAPQASKHGQFFHLGRALPPAFMRFTLGLKSDSSALVKSLLDISDPASPNYRQHLSKDEVDQLTAPAPEAVQTVTNWLQKNNITAETYSSSGNMLRIQVPFEQANALLNANFSTYVHGPTNTTMVRTLAYSLPADMSEHVTFVYPTTQYVQPSNLICDLRAWN